MEIIGPSGCGKSHLISRLIAQHLEICDTPVKKILYIYSHYQPLYAQMQAEHPHIIFTDRIQDIDEHAGKDPMLVIIDDWMDKLIPRSPALDIVTRYFVKSSHHLSK